MRIDFHSLDMNTSVKYDTRIVANTVGGGALAYNATSHRFTGTVYFDYTPYVNSAALPTVADVVNTQANYATLASPALTANHTVAVWFIYILTLNTNTTMVQNSVGKIY